MPLVVEVSNAVAGALYVRGQVFLFFIQQHCVAIDLIGVLLLSH